LYKNNFKKKTEKDFRKIHVTLITSILKDLLVSLNLFIIAILLCKSLKMKEIEKLNKIIRRNGGRAPFFIVGRR